MALLVLAEHDNKTLKGATLNAVAAAAAIGGELHVLVAGADARPAADAAAKVAGVAKVLLAEDKVYAHPLAEDLPRSAASSMCWWQERTRGPLPTPRPRLPAWRRCCSPRTRSMRTRSPKMWRT